MLVALAGANLAVELGSDLIQELIDAIPIARGHTAHSAVGRVHGHGGGDEDEINRQLDGKGKKNADAKAMDAAAMAMGGIKEWVRGEGGRRLRKAEIFPNTASDTDGAAARWHQGTSRGG